MITMTEIDGDRSTMTMTTEQGEVTVKGYRGADGRMTYAVALDGIGAGSVSAPRAISALQGFGVPWLLADEALFRVAVYTDHVPA